jgi:uncharacterized protein YfdQ (DUF2303 family)
MEENEVTTENGALLKFMSDFANSEPLDFVRGTAEAATVHLVPAGMQVFDPKKILDQYLPAPERRTGTTRLADVESFSAYVNRHRRPETVVFADLDANGSPGLECVFDADHAGPEGAGWNRHRATYAFPLSVEWLAWRKAHGAQQAQADFASFVDERAADLLDAEALPAEAPQRVLAERLGVQLASAQEVIAASRGLRLRAEVDVTEVVSVSSGETELMYGEKHRAEGGGALKVPTAFLVGIPVFRGEPRDVFLVRLRYRRHPSQAARIVWTLSLHQVDDVLRGAVREVVERVRVATGLPVFLGAAPKER